MRLIDADELITTTDIRQDGTVSDYVMCCEIDNAPTIKAIPIEVLDQLKAEIAIMYYGKSITVKDVCDLIDRKISEVTEWK